MGFTPTDPAYPTDDPDELRAIIEAGRARVARLEGALGEIAEEAFTCWTCGDPESHKAALASIEARAIGVLHAEDPK